MEPKPHTISLQSGRTQNPGITDPAFVEGRSFNGRPIK
jgi:hypothetical protein